MAENSGAKAGPGEGYATPCWIGVIAAYLVLLTFGLTSGLMLLWPSCEVPGDAGRTAKGLTVISVTPSFGKAGGGDTVTIRGTGFEVGSAVTFGGNAGADVNLEGPTALTARTPPGNAGRVAAIVSNPDKKSATLRSGFIYVDPEAPLPKPSISSLAPISGPLAGGQSVTLVGSGFSGVTSVGFGGLPGTHVDVFNDTTLTVNTPAHPEGKVDVVVGDGSTATLSNGFTYTCWGAMPYRMLLMVILAGALGGTLHAMRSLYWYVGNRDLRWSWLLMYCLLPVSGAAIAVIFFLLAYAGLYTVQGTGSFILIGLSALVGMFSVQAADKLKAIAEGLLTSAVTGSEHVPPQPAPTTAAQQPRELVNIASVTPPSGPSAGAQVVTITGTGLSGVTTVQFDGRAATSVQAASDTSVTATTPAHPAGPVDVVVGDGHSTATISGGYTYT